MWSEQTSIRKRIAGDETSYWVYNFEKSYKDVEEYKKCLVCKSFYTISWWGRLNIQGTQSYLLFQRLSRWTNIALLFDCVLMTDFIIMYGKYLILAFFKNWNYFQTVWHADRHVRYLWCVGLVIFMLTVMSLNEF